jgi:DNA-binding response OmpR family regulator
LSLFAELTQPLPTYVKTPQGRAQPRPFGIAPLAHLHLFKGITNRKDVHGGGKVTRVLLAEDEEGIRSLLAEVLSGAGYEVVDAENGDAAALKMDSQSAFDLLVTDIHMPGHLTGLDLARKFRERYAGSPILYVTGRPDAIRDASLQDRGDMVLFKPLKLMALVATVRSLLDAAAAAEAISSEAG